MRVLLKHADGRFEFAGGTREDRERASNWALVSPPAHQPGSL